MRRTTNHTKWTISNADCFLFTPSKDWKNEKRLKEYSKIWDQRWRFWIFQRNLCRYRPHRHLFHYPISFNFCCLYTTRYHNRHLGNCNYRYIIPFFNKWDIHGWSTLLSKKFGFKKTERGFETNSYNILRLIKSSKYMFLLASAFFLILSILSLIYHSPPLIYAISLINFLGLLLVSLQMAFQYYKSKKKQGNINSQTPAFLAVVMTSSFFVIFIMSHLIDYYPLIFFSSFFLYIILIYSIPTFVRDLIRINKFRKWSQSIYNISKTW